MYIEGKIVDLTERIEEGMPFYPSDPRPELIQFKTLDIDGYNVKQIVIGTHSGTHVDAPIHALKNGIGIDKMDPMACSGEAEVLDVSYEREVKPDLLTKDLRGKVVLFYTGSNDEWKPGWSMSSFSYLGVETAKRLVSIGPRAIGIDSPSVEGPYTGRDVHTALLTNGIPIVENISGSLKALLGKDFYFLCLFLPIKDGDGSPARAMAFLR
ncbi:MAG: cyclase family protein [Nitrososphaerota archaeon]|jgi:arylformamidase|nr:cyclase family protein [Nitrososphaerota archaeon]